MLTNLFVIVLKFEVINQITFFKNFINL